MIKNKQRKKVKNMGWKSTETNKFTFEQDGDQLIGRLVGLKDTKYGGKAYDLIDANGEKFYFFGSAHLDRELVDHIDDIVSITYKGEKKIDGNKTLKVFKVDFWEAKNGELPEGFAAESPF